MKDGVGVIRIKSNADKEVSNHDNRLLAEALRIWGAEREVEGVGLGISPVLENAISPLGLSAVREITMVTSSAARDRKGRKSSKVSR